MARHKEAKPEAEPLVLEAEGAEELGDWSAWAVPCAVVLLTLIVFWGNVHHVFLDWDDNHNFVENKSYQGLSASHLKWIFYGSVFRGNYEPLHWLSMALIHSVWDLMPGPYHAYGVLLHALTAGALYFLGLKLLSLALPERAEDSPEALRLAAGAGALLFSLHPLRVEVVSWASGMHYIPPTLFGLACAWCYLWAYEARGQVKVQARRTWLACAALALSMLYLPLWMFFPFALLAMDYYPLRRTASLWRGKGAPASWPRLVLEKWPYWLVAGTGGWMMLYSRQFSKVYQGLTTLEKFGVKERIAECFYGLATYVAKTVVPYGLCPLYEVPAHMNPFAPVFLTCAAFVAAGAALILALRKKAPYLIAAFAFYAVTVAPVLGITQSGPQLAADRYTYIPCLAFPLLAAAGLFWLWRPGEKAQPRFWSGLGLCAAALIALSVKTRAYTAVWADSESLWTYALTIDPHMSYANNNKGNALSKRGELDEAVKHYDDAIATKPDDPNPYYNKGLAMFDRGKYKEAIELYDKALALNPLYADCHAERGVALKNLGRVEEALEEYRLALRIEPKHAEALNSMGVAFASQGKFAESIAWFQKALAANPYHAKAMANWGNSLSSMGKLDEAITRYRESARMDPGYADAHNNLGDALAKQGKNDEAAAEFREALRLNPNYQNAKVNLARLTGKLSPAPAPGQAATPDPNSAEGHHAKGLALARAGKIEEAMAEFKETVRLSPKWSAARNNLGASLARLGKTDEAVAEYRAALELQADYPDAHNNLGMALANQRKWEESIAEFKAALKLKPDLAGAQSNLDQVYKISGIKPAP